VLTRRLEPRHDLGLQRRRAVQCFEQGRAILRIQLGEEVQLAGEVTVEGAGGEICLGGDVSQA
jgi:hypothetical protein